MMLPQQHTLSLSNYSELYDLIVPQDNLLRKINELIDFSFVYKELSDKYCQHLINSLNQQEILASFPLIKEKMNYLQEAIEDTKDYYLLSKDKDARIGYKTTNSKFFGYKTHLAMSQERIITAASITSGEKDDGKQLPVLLEKSLINGIMVDTIIADTAYSCKFNLRITQENNIKLVSKLHPNLAGTHDKNDGFTFNKDAAMYVCPAGHIATKRAKHGKKTARSYHYFCCKCKKNYKADRLIIKNSICTK